jgi:hypothetical protein
LPRKCGSLDVSQPCGARRPVKEIALPFYIYAGTFFTNGALEESVKNIAVRTRTIFGKFVLRCKRLRAYLATGGDSFNEGSHLTTTAMIALL